MSREERALEFEALAIEGTAVCCDIQGMKYENEQRKAIKESMAYVEGDFLVKSDELREIAGKIRGLKNS